MAVSDYFFLLTFRQLIFRAWFEFNPTFGSKGIFLLRKRLNGGTVLPLKRHPGGPGPLFNMHPGGTVPPFKMHPGGTVPPFKMHPGGTLKFDDTFFWGFNSFV